MGSLRSRCCPLILVHILLLQIQPVKVHRLDPASQKLSRLNEQFQQFLTQARLDMLDLNQNRNSSGELESQVHALNDRWLQISRELEDVKQSTTQEIEGLRDWSRKLEKKNKRMEGRLALMERNMRENRRHALKQKSDPIQDFFNLTVELQSQDERLAALQVQRDELLVGLKGLQESLKNQALRVTRLEGRLNEALVPQEYHEPRGRSQSQRRGKQGRTLDGQTQGRSKGISYSQATAQSRDPLQPHQHQATPNQPDSDIPQSQIQMQTQTRPYPSQQSRHNMSYPYAKIHSQGQQQPQTQLYNQRHHQSQQNPSWLQRLSHNPTHPEPNDDKQRRRTLLEAADPLPPPKPESYQLRVSGGKWGGREKEESNTESSVIDNLLQLPVRQKIPARPVPRRDATICNVDSMLFFPSASAENYVTFSSTLPDLHELSVCLWLHVKASHVGTLLSYATDNNDNQLVLYGRNSPASQTSSSLSHLGLDFVIGDPVYRRLPLPMLLDSHWHHLCVIWSSIQGHFWHYSDGHLTSSGSNFRKGWEIPGGGLVVLGQEQDAVGGGFDPAEGFTGQVAGFWVWKRVLSPSEVEGVAAGRGLPRGVVLGMEDIEEVHGEVQQVACECLEHCY